MSLLFTPTSNGGSTLILTHEMKPEWKDYMEKGAFNQTFMTGKEYSDWLTKAEATHKQLMQEFELIAK